MIGIIFYLFLQLVILWPKLYNLAKVRIRGALIHKISFTAFSLSVPQYEYKQYDMSIDSKARTLIYLTLKLSVHWTI